MIILRMLKSQNSKEITKINKIVNARVDTVDGGVVSIEDILSLDGESAALGLHPEWFRRLAKKRLSERHPKHTQDEIGKLCSEIFPTGRKRAIYKFFDDLDSGHLSRQKIGNVTKEAKQLHIDKTRFRKIYFKRMLQRHPNYTSANIQETYIFRFRVKQRKIPENIRESIHQRVDKIDKGEITRDQVKNLTLEAAAFGLHRNTFEDIVKLRLHALHSDLASDQINHLTEKIFPNVHVRERKAIYKIYNRVDAVEIGKVPLENVRSIDEEASVVGRSTHQFRIHVKERLAGLHPDWNTKQIGRHCEEIFPKRRIREIYTRVDNVDSEHVPPHQVKGIMAEVDRARYTHDRFKKHVMTRLRQRHPDLTPAELAKLYRERFNRYALPVKKVQEIQDLGWMQYVEKGKGEHLTLDKIGQQTGVNVRSVAEYILEDFHRRFVEEGKAHEDADIVYNETFPQDEGARLGKLNHRFYERLAAHGHNFLRVKYPGLGPIFWEVALKNQKIADLILPDAYKSGYLRDCYMTSNLDGKTMGDVLGIPPKAADKFTDIIIDFTTRYNKEMFEEKATKYCDGHTLVIVACTGRYPFEDRRPLKLRDNPDVIGLPVAVVFRFLQLPEIRILAAYYGTQMTQKLAFEQLQKFTDVIGKRQHKNRQTLEYKNFLAQRDNEERKRAEIFVLEARQYEEGQFTIHKYEGSR